MPPSTWRWPALTVKGPSVWSGRSGAKSRSCPHGVGLKRLYRLLSTDCVAASGCSPKDLGVIAENNRATAPATPRKLNDTIGLIEGSVQSFNPGIFERAGALP